MQTLTCSLEHVVHVLEVAGVRMAGVDHVGLAALRPSSTLGHGVLRLVVLHATNKHSEEFIECTSTFA